MNPEDLIWGVDLGGTKVECAVMSRSDNKIINRQRVPTESKNGYDHILNQIHKVITLVSKEVNAAPLTVGFSTPGTLDPTSSLLKNSNTTCMNDKPLKADLEAKLGVPIAMANDANCFALAEATMGAGKEYPNANVVFGVILGTGVGGGVVVNGKVIGGKHGIGGEWGHNVLVDNGLDCYCGKKGCNEKYFAGPALERHYFEKTGVHKSLKDIATDSTDPDAVATIDFLLHSFGKAISYIVNVLDPDLIILGGGVSNVDRLYSEGSQELAKWIFNNKKVDVPILPPKLGDSAGVFGAIELVR